MLSWLLRKYKIAYLTDYYIRSREDKVEPLIATPVKVNT